MDEFDEKASNIVSETQLIDNTRQEAHKVKSELVALIAAELRAVAASARAEGAAAERERCYELVKSSHVEINADGEITVMQAQDICNQSAQNIARAIRAQEGEHGRV